MRDTRVPNIGHTQVVLFSKGMHPVRDLPFIIRILVYIVNKDDRGQGCN